MVVIRQLPEKLAASSGLDVLLRKTRYLLVAVQDEPGPVAAGTLLGEGTKAGCAPERDHVRLRHQQHLIGKIREESRTVVHSAGTVHHYVAIMVDEEAQ